MPRVKYLGKGLRILAISGIGVIKLTPGEEVFVEDRVAYRMLEANSTGRKPLYEFLDQFPPEKKVETLNIKQEVVLPEPPEGLLPYMRKFKGTQTDKPMPPKSDKPKRVIRQPELLSRKK